MSNNRHSNRTGKFLLLGRLLARVPDILALEKRMLIVHVSVRVRPEAIEAFKEATRLNAKASLREPGVARFDVVQNQDDPAHFILIEVYRTADASAAHKETTHYQAWRDAVASMMAEPRSSTKFHNVFPDDSGW